MPLQSKFRVKIQPGKAQVQVSVVVALAVTLAMLLMPVQVTRAARPLPVLPPAKVTFGGEDMARSRALADVMQPYVQRDTNGRAVVTLQPGQQVGVSPEDLAAFGEAIASINQLVDEGYITLDENLRPVMTSRVPSAGGSSPLGRTAPASGGVAAGPAGAEPDWGATPFWDGIRFYITSYELNYITNWYIGNIASIAVYCGRPAIASNLLFLFYLNYPTFYYGLYGGGSYFYTPWSYLYGGFNYKYVWVYRIGYYYGSYGYYYQPYWCWY